MNAAVEEAKNWEDIASGLAVRVESTIEYYRAEVAKCSKRDRAYSIGVLALGVITPILVTLSTNKALGGESIASLQIAAIITSSALAFLEGVRRICAYDKRWAKAYMSMLALRRARAEYKLNRIGLAPESPERKKLLVSYQSFFHDLITKESQEYFTGMAAETKS